MAKRFTLAAIIEGKDKLSGVMDGISQGAMMRFGGMATDLVSQLPGLAVELVNLGAQAEAMEHRFTQFAGGADRAAEFLQAFQDAGDGTVSKMDAMAGGAKLLQMQLVSNADEMKSVASIALKLGDQTQGAGDRIADFAALLANQSIPRLDNFGISSGKVRERIDELLKSGEALDRETAFKMAVMEEGAEALDILGDTSELTSTKIDKLKAAVEDAKLGFAEMAVDALDAAGGVDGIATSIRGLPDTVRQLGMLSAAGITALEAFLRGEDAGEAFNNEMEEMLDITAEVTDAQVDMAMGTNEFMGSTDELEKKVNKLNTAYEVAVKNLDPMTRAMGFSEEMGWQAEAAMVDLAESIDGVNTSNYDAEASSKALAKALAEEEAAAIEAKGAMLDMTMSWKSFFDKNEDAAEKFADDRQGIEEEHQKRLTDIQKKGQSTAIRLDATAEEEKLTNLKKKLEIALLQQSEFTDKTKESTRLSKQNQIDTLAGQITEQSTLLDNYYAGRLVRQGQNITGELAAEETRYAEQLATLNTAQREQEEAQRQSMGRMMLQSFEAWATMKGIPAGKMLEMRTAIAQEYGLIDAETAAAVTTMTGSWETWATDFSEDAGTVMDKMDKVVISSRIMAKVLEEIPRRVDIDIVVNQRFGAGGELTLGAGLVEGFQGGTSFFGGGLAMVGERGPELVALPRGSRIHSAGETRNISSTTGSNNTVNIYDARAMTVYLEEQRRQKRSELRGTI